MRSAAPARCYASFDSPETVCLEEPPSRSKGSCSGCGSFLQTTDSGSLGYLPEAVLESFSSGWRAVGRGLRGVPVDDVPVGESVLRTRRTPRQFKQKILCANCFGIQHYRGGSPQAANPAQTDDVRLPHIPHDSLVFYLIDASDPFGSFSQRLHQYLCEKHVERVLYIFNKIDRISSDPAENLEISKNLAHSIKALKNQSVIGLSAKEGWGFKELEEKLSTQTNRPKTLFVVGSVNSGKSTFVNRFLKFVGYKHLGNVDLKGGMGGLTVAPIAGTTRENQKFIVGQDKQKLTVWDTVGVRCSSEEISKFIPTSTIWGMSDGILKRRVIRIRQGKSLVVGGVAVISLDSEEHVENNQIIECPPISLVTYFPEKVTLNVCGNSKILNFLKNTKFHFPGLSDRKEISSHSVETFKCLDDIAIPGLGWIRPEGRKGYTKFRVLVPQGLAVLRRQAIIIGHKRTAK